MINRKRHWILTMPLAAALLAAAAGPVGAAPPPSITATLTASASCQLTATVSWKSAKVDYIGIGWYETGFVNADYPTNTDYIATSEWPSTVNGGVAKGKTVTFGFGPVGTDSSTHDWRVLVMPYSGGVALPQLTAYLTTNCYLPSPV